MRERIGPVGVGPDLEHQRVGLEFFQGAGNHSLERFQPGRISRSRRQRYVDRGFLCIGTADFRDKAGCTGKQPLRPFVKRNRQDIGVVPENGLDAVAMMDVDIDVRHFLEACVLKRPNPERKVVERAEPAGVIGVRVVQPARDVERDVELPARDEFCGVDGAARVQPRRRPDAVERRRISRPQSESPQAPVRRASIGQQNGVEIRCRVNPEKLIGRGGSRSLQRERPAFRIERSGGFEQIVDPLQPPLLERVALAQIVGQKLVGVKKRSTSRHGLIIPLR